MPPAGQFQDCPGLYIGESNDAGVPIDFDPETVYLKRRS